LIGVVTLLLLLAFSWDTRRALRSARRELLAVTNANEFLRKTLGEMTIASTAKDRQIDRLQNSPCEGQDKSPPGVRAGDAQPFRAILVVLPQGLAECKLASIGNIPSIQPVMKTTQFEAHDSGDRSPCRTHINARD
jgi:hypothetical protein